MSTITDFLRHHITELQASGLTDETILASGIKSETSHAALRLLLNWPAMPKRMASGIVFQFRDSAGNLNGYSRFKPDAPRKDRNGKPIKYESPRGQPNHIYIPPNTAAALVAEQLAMLLITEGEKKSLAADQAGIPCLGLVGVFGWKDSKHERLLPDLELIEWRGRKVVIGFDSDIATNPNIADAESRFAAQLVNRGAIVTVIRLPDGPDGQKMGLDDFLVQHGVDAFWILLNKAEAPAAVDSGTAKSDSSDIDAMHEARRILAASATHKEGHEELHKLKTYRGEFWWYTGTHYREEADTDLEATIIQFLDASFRKLTKTAVSNVSLCLKSETNVNSHKEMPTWLDGTTGGNSIAMKNGILDIAALLKGRTDVLVPHTPRYFSANVLPYNFDPSATCPKWFAFLNRNLEGDQERIALLQQYSGYCLTPTLSAHKFLFNEGEGANGKSVYCAALTGMLGQANVSSVPLEQFGERFALYPTIGKLANIAAEVGEIDRVAEGILKSYTTGDAIQFDRKHRDPITARPTAKLIFASNNRPRFSDKSGGLWRRMILMPWRITIPEAERVFGMDSPQWWQDQGELPGILHWAIAGLWQFEQQGGFTKSAVCEAALSEYRAESNPARLFLEERFHFDPESWMVCEDVYLPYAAWSKANGFMALSASSFGHEVRRAFPLVERRKKLIGSDRSQCYFGLTDRR